MLEYANRFLWGSLLTSLMLAVGIYLSFSTRFLQFRCFGKILKETVGSLFKQSSKSGISPFAAMSAALSGTMGTGNIIGVGIAIGMGGAGALFWMWISALLCMIIKYAEVALAVFYREKGKNGEWHGGPMYYIKNGLGKKFMPCAYMFCICTAAASFGIGGAAQSGSLSGAFEYSLGISPLVCGIVTAALTIPVIFGSAKTITSFTSYLIPFMSVFYLGGAATLLFINRSHIPSAVSEIFSDAFCIKSASGGILGALTSDCIRHGISKGIFTNEAGMGSAPIVHASADNTPKRQGYWGAFEVFLDTVVMCGITGLLILCSTGYRNRTATGKSLTLSAFEEVFGRGGAVFLAVSVALFAYGAMIGWSYYGSECCLFLFKKKKYVNLYKAIFVAVVAAGGVLPLEYIFEISDLLNGIMALPNLLAILLLGSRIKEITDN